MSLQAYPAFACDLILCTRRKFARCRLLHLLERASTRAPCVGVWADSNIFRQFTRQSTVRLRRREAWSKMTRWTGGCGCQLSADLLQEPRVAR